MQKAVASSHYLKYGIRKAKQGDADKKDDEEDSEGTKKADEGEEGLLDEVEAPCPEDDEECIQAKQELQEVEQTKFSEYSRKLFLGIIKGFVSNFNQNCAVGLTTSVNSFFDIIDNLAVYNPTKTAKFQISSVNFTEATNQVYAYCDVNQLTKQFTMLSDYENYENYFVFASRIGGTLVNTYPEMMACINDGQRKSNGFDVGYCGSTLASTFLDTSF
uniref:Uncharacterized protein n=1 Tax=Favella ehrenbergii TaxID=182087 RepID=A0A7S3MI58_9SPIT|mmetsp:Transcript_10627/g.13136  ORF Transcript_10627/g.13136 Transcript_10627/m.13136 type:complete len:217 (+) Transcript_10627:250-900(+)|eukprot:CAMPEP_0170471946 /NCGR_PEP_ID=MMETSP0123-20130129/14071_1 /TAXON_ID=182087 /ORGANISM="Favella ehrenbergii, Strain Fehren 1" /LENGTH=216 /DNA_ID=CAMNT_0010739913 /DNA_START=301 /DNA_END=951 /DNA_ORIENTATION=+